MSRFTLALSVMFILLLAACGQDHIDSNTWSGETSESALIDEDGDGVPDSIESELCGREAILLDSVHPAYNSDEGFVPAADEICDGLDNDCDGRVDEDEDEIVRDLDGDGIPDCRDGDIDGDFVPEFDPQGNVLDCDGTNPDIHLNATEVCDGIDNNCDGVIDEENAAGCTELYWDEDEDGFGHSDIPALCLCESVDDYTATQAGDCNDGEPGTFPGAEELCNGIDDNCNGSIDDEYTDTDSDGVADCIDGDDDDDGVLDGIDNCILVSNADQTDTDGDGLGNACEADSDNDGVCDDVVATLDVCSAGPDNCLLVWNQDQLDTDSDGLGDLCDDDDDDDGVEDVEDNCVFIPNPDQNDNDDDGLGDLCDPDDDDDGVVDGEDNCVFTPNPNQNDNDDDGLGDLCDPDDDNDEVCDSDEAIPGICSLGPDNCPNVANPDQADTDGDGTGDACVDDNDGDGDPDASDCDDADPLIHHAAPEICDGVDNDCDGEIDEIFPDNDGNGVADCLDGDIDGDGVPNAMDCNPTDPDIYPNAPNDECDGVDNDCDGEIDESPTALTGTRFFFDGDVDTYGVLDRSLLMCAPSGRFSAIVAGDCQDGMASINPGAIDIPDNGIDENCDGFDADGQCVLDCDNRVCGADGCGGSCGDCDAGNVCSLDGQCEIIPLTEGSCEDGLDNDGDGRIDCSDRDCHSDPVCEQCQSGSDCEDNNPGTVNVCTLDNQCAFIWIDGHCNQDNPCDGADEVCVDNFCVDPAPECVEDVDCAGGEVCDDGVCAEGAVPISPTALCYTPDPEYVGAMIHFWGASGALGHVPAIEGLNCTPEGVDSALVMAIEVGQVATGDCRNDPNGVRVHDLSGPGRGCQR
jgi:hypothetical protein